MTEEDRISAQQKISERLLASRPYERAEDIYCYASFGDEADTFCIMEEALRCGKKVAVPKVLGKRKMEFYYIRSTADLSPGFASIPEPADWCEKAPVPGEDSLVIVPGTAFDRQGRRIGYGGGYYDAFLAGCPRCRRAALAFDVQCSEEPIPAEPHDIRVEAVITEKELIRCTQDFPEIR